MQFNIGAVLRPKVLVMVYVGSVGRLGITAMSLRTDERSLTIAAKTVHEIIPEKFTTKCNHSCGSLGILVQIGPCIIYSSISRLQPISSVRW